MISQDLKPYATALLASLKAAGVQTILVSFEGSGDSGSIHEVEIAGGEPPATAQWPQQTSAFVDNEWVTTTTVVDMPIKKALEECCYDALENTGVDWYNNDGGFGELWVDFATAKVGMEVNQRYTQTEYSSFDLKDDVEVN